MIKPTIGRRVWFYPNGATSVGSGTGNLAVIDTTQPMDAGIVFVWGDRMVNLDIADHYGKHHAMNSVALVQEGDTPPPYGAYATWMPYQQGQAKKDAAAA